MKQTTCLPRSFQMLLRCLCLFMILYTSPFLSFLSLNWPPFYPFTGLTGPQRCPHYGPHQEPPQCPSRAEHSVAIEKLSRVCDWLLVNKEVSAVRGLWGTNYRRERGRITMNGSERGVQQREEEGKKAKVPHCISQAIRRISKSPTGSSLTHFDTLHH